MVIEIKKFVNSQLLSPIKGCLFYSGGFSRNEVSIVEGKLVSDMELLFVYNERTGVKELQRLIREIESALPNRFPIIPSNFEIEIECIALKEIRRKSYMIPVHQFEAIKTNKLIFNNLEKSDVFENISVIKDSVYDIFLHRILNQISLAFNFKNRKINSVYLNRTKKNASDFLTFRFLLYFNKDTKWIVKKSERIPFLLKHDLLETFTEDYFNSELNTTEDKQFYYWKTLMSDWHKLYLSLNSKLTSLSNKKSLFGKLYTLILSTFLKIFNKSPLTQSDLISEFMLSLEKSSNFTEFNAKLYEKLSFYGYSFFTYPYLNGLFFAYWIRHAKYYKSLK